MGLVLFWCRRKRRLLCDRGGILNKMLWDQTGQLDMRAHIEAHPLHDFIVVVDLKR